MVRRVIERDLREAQQNQRRSAPRFETTIEVAWKKSWGRQGSSPRVAQPGSIDVSPSPYSRTFLLPPLQGSRRERLAGRGAHLTSSASHRGLALQHLRGFRFDRLMHMAVRMFTRGLGRLAIPTNPQPCASPPSGLAYHMSSRRQHGTAMK